MRTVRVLSHQIAWDGWFHGWSRNEDGVMVAIIEDERGVVQEVRMCDSYRLEFKESLISP